MYDSANQLIRENNQAGNFTHTWTYDNAGNIRERKEYAYTTGNLSAATRTVNYGYPVVTDPENNTLWGDLLTSYDGTAITYDQIGNPETFGDRAYTWEYGRQLKSLTENGTTWTYTYDAGGLRTGRTNGTSGGTYAYTYTGSQLTQMKKGTSNTLTFTYDASGIPLTVTHNGTKYYYATNLQGDVVAILDASGTEIVSYTYDAWGKCLNSYTSGIGFLNPLRYRGYVYDQQTELYYLQSRYYDPAVGRFLNADVFAATGQGFIGNNMFVYCRNDPINLLDRSGMVPTWEDILEGLERLEEWAEENIIEPIAGVANDILEDFQNFDSSNGSETKALDSNYFSCYKGVLVIRTNGNRSGSFGMIFLTRETNNRANPEDVVRHEYGHVKQLQKLGPTMYTCVIFIPSWLQLGSGEYYSKPWEITADIYGGVQSRTHTQENINEGNDYLAEAERLRRKRWFIP